MSVTSKNGPALPVTQWRDVIHMEPGVQLAAAGWIPEQPQAIALISHGTSEHLGRYGHIITPLVEDGFAVYGPDHRGHGRSSGTRALTSDIDRSAADLHVLALHAGRKFPGLPVMLIGHSMGGLIALRYAFRYQAELSALVTSGPAVIIDHGASETASKIGEMLGKVAPTAPTPHTRYEAIDDTPVGSGLSSEPFVSRQFQIDHYNWHGDIRLGSTSAMLQSARDSRQRFEELHIPLLAVHGADDPITSPHGTELLYERASSEDKTIIIWEGRRHEIFNSPGRDLVIDTMRRWLAERVIA